ncbi:MAG: peptidylprolyl isomerase [Chloroflexi bacterium]|nr:peptidylprolyl isomerase [Chloroflexota bacterium]
MDTIQNDTVVQIAYNLTVEGEEVESNLLEYLQGHGNIIPGLETALLGLQEGERKHVVVAAEQAYGAFDPALVLNVNRSSFPDDFEIHLGQPMNLRDASGNVFQAVATALSEDSVELDMNHPMAGKVLEFQVTVLSIRPASEEEIAHGHLHYANGCAGCSSDDCGPGCDPGCC